MICYEICKEVERRKRRLLPIILKVKFGDTGELVEKVNSDLFLKYKERQAEEIIRRAEAMFDDKLAVALSGGKDSLIVLDMARKIMPDIKVIYNNTTIEFPETLMYVRRLEKEWDLNLVMTYPKTNFFRAVRERGWATHEDRWCCRPFKEEPAAEYMRQGGILAELTGTTRNESIYRRSLKPFKMPSKEPYIIRINPIYDWNDQEVWKYIEENKLPYNPLYDMGYRRIGCWCCPLNGPSHYRRLKRTHPRLYEFLERFEPAHPQSRTRSRLEKPI
ncbi:MAG: phosphoadenosine phosphosulfate reductase family protein [Candidatus Methanomethylicaceae archaeon]